MRAARTNALILILAGFALAPGKARADITYTIVDYPADENGYTVSGTITTDGSTGTETSGGFIESWSVSITKNGTTIADFASTQSGFVSVSGDLVVTSTSIDLAPAPPSGLGGGYLQLTGQNNYSIDWSDDGFVTGHPLYSAGSISPPTYYWNSSGAAAPTEIATATAVVPEPSTAAVAVLGAASGLAYGLVRKRGARRA